MFDDDILHNSDSEGVLVVGYPPSKFDPSIPGTLFIKKDCHYAALSQGGIEKQATDEDMLEAIPCKAFLRAGEWAAVSDGKLMVMPIEDLMQWRNQKAIEMVKMATNIRNNPIKTLRILESAANLRSLNLADFVSVLKAQRAQHANGDEDLGSVFLRVRGNRPGGQKPG